MKILFVLPLLLAALPAATRADPRGDELLDRERAFARHAQEAGVRAAFLEAMAPNALLLRPGPVDGPAWQAAQPDPPIRLHWCPAQWLLSASDDLGVTLGPWWLTSLQDSEVRGHGTFFSVWQRRADGGLKLLTDAGVSGGELRTCPDATQAIAARGEPLPEAAPASARQLRWQALGAADDARNAGPAGDRAEITLHEAAPQGRGLPARQAGRRLSAAADLGVSWGAIGDPAQEGYVRVWLFQDGHWLLLIERTP